MEFNNLTPFPCLVFEAIDQHNQEFHVVAIRATFDITPDAEMKPAEEQQPLAVRDEFFGEVNKSSIRQESDLSPYKPNCDVIVIGSAYAPDGKPAPRFEVGIRITGSVMLDKKLAINGPRFWEKHGSEWVITEPEPIASLPLQYEYAYGGECRINKEDPAADRIEAELQLTPEQRRQHPEGEEQAPVAHTAYEHNPVGMGFAEQWYIDATKPPEAVLDMDGHEQRQEPPVDVIDGISRRLGLTHAPLPAPVREKSIPVKSEYKFPAPQIESPADPILEFGKQYFPQGLGVITKAWEQRLKLAGTYDKKWLEEKWPVLPNDFDFAYWNGAHPDMQVPHLKGNELFELSNLTSQGTLKFLLPGLLMFMMADHEEDGEKLIPARLDTVCIEPDTMKVNLVWRAVVPTTAELMSLAARMVPKEDKTEQDKIWGKMSLLNDCKFIPGKLNG